MTHMGLSFSFYVQRFQDDCYAHVGVAEKLFTLA